jgi:RNA recognition motif-containing protein
LLRVLVHFYYALQALCLTVCYTYCSLLAAPICDTHAHTVFVGNLAWGTTDQDLESHFSSLGGVQSAQVQVVPSGRSKGWGLVTFAQPEQASSAVELLGDSSLHERRLTIRLDRK